MRWRRSARRSSGVLSAYRRPFPEAALPRPCVPAVLRMVQIITFWSEGLSNSPGTGRLRDPISVAVLTRFVTRSRTFMTRRAVVTLLAALAALLSVGGGVGRAQVPYPS